MAANEANPDPNTSVVAASAILLALFAQRRSGVGQIVHINMQVANAWANADDFLDYPGKPPRVPIDADHHGLGACYRLYPTADGWVFFAATTDREFTAFCRSAQCERLLDDSRFDCVATRSEHDDALVEVLSTIFATRSASMWEEVLTASGVGCVRADGVDVGRFLTSDPHIIGNGWAPVADHRRFGTLRRWGPVVTVGGLNPDYRSAPIAGEHTDALLAECGYSADAIRSIRANKTVNSEPIDRV